MAPGHQVPEGTTRGRKRGREREEKGGGGRPITKSIVRQLCWRGAVAAAGVAGLEWVITSRRGWMRCIHSAPLRALPACAAPFCAWHQEALEKTPWVAAQLEDRMAKREDLVGWLATVSPQEALAAAAP